MKTHACQVLRSKIEEGKKNKDGIWSTVTSTLIHEAPFELDTDLGKQKYDLVTMDEVIYYYPDTPALLK